MSTHDHHPPTVTPRDAVRIVPLAIPGTLLQPLIGAIPRATAPPRLTYRGGPLLTAVEIFTVFWGEAWATADASIAAQMNAFFDFILSSSLIDQLAEYGVAANQIGHRKRIGTVTLTTPAPPASVSDGDLQTLIQSQIGATTLPAPSLVVFKFQKK